jgi:hypothetical protein
MDESAFVGENAEVIEATSGIGAAFSWSAAIAGALAATAVTFVAASLGTGIELAMASPAGTMTIAGAVWLALALALGFAAGGFTAGRLRLNLGTVPPAETRFRDGANGFMVWAIGAVAVAAMLAVVGAITVANAARTREALVGQAPQNTPAGQVGYFVDWLTRTPRPTQTIGNVDAEHAQITRILANAVREGQLSADDRTYLAALVAARTGVSQDDAQRRVDDMLNRAQDSAKQVVDTTRKAGAHIAFFIFVSMLFGAVAATLGGILGGELRDESLFGSTRASASRR